MAEPFLHPDRLLPTEPDARRRSRAVYDAIADLPIVSPHGHTDPAWFAENAPFGDAASLFLTPDHYVLRMLKSRGLSYDDLGVPRAGASVAEPRAAWRLFAAHYHFFLGAPSRLWIDHALHWAFGVDEPLSAENADALFDHIGARLAEPDLLPMAVLDKARVETIATTDFALDALAHHEALAAQGWIGRIRATYRPDDVTDPDQPKFRANLARLADATGADTASWDGMIEAHRRRRAEFRRFGAVASDHAAPTARTADLAAPEKQALLTRLLADAAEPGDAELFRAQMLTEMAGLAVEDGMVMQVHAGARRNTDPALFAERGPNLGADIPAPVDVVGGLAPLLARYGGAPGFRLIFFCLDESVYAREIAPMAGYWPSLLIGPPWWFHDSPRGIARYLDAVVESAGFFNLAGFNDDTRALLSIPARHDVWRRGVAAFLGDMVVGGALSAASAEEIGRWLAYDAAKAAYALD